MPDLSPFVLRPRERRVTVRPRQRRPITAAALVVTIVVASCGSVSRPAAPDPPSLDVCVDPLGKPMQFEDPRHPGEYLGMAVQLIAELTDRAGLEVSWKPTLEVNARRDLLDGRCDVLLARFVEDGADLRFTRPYLEHAVAAARLASGPEFPSLDFVVDRRIGVRESSAPRDWLLAHLPVGATVVSLPSTGDLVAALKASRVDSLRPTSVDAIVDDWTSLAYRSKDDPELVLFQTTPTGLNVAMAVRPDDTDTFDLVDTGLRELVADGTVADVSAELFFPATD
jgi:polar amino acid transport system substrate-binding protein